MATIEETAIKYSNEVYATKQFVKQDMKIPFIDHIWTKIIEYRSNFNNILTLKHIDGTLYSMCLTPTIANSVNEIERKLLKLSKNYFKLTKNFSNKEFKKISYSKCLQSIARKQTVEIDDITLKMIVSNSPSVLPAKAIPLNRYYECLKMIEKQYLEEISDATLADFYSILTGQSELTEFYRTREIDNLLSKVVIDKLYLGIPVNAIEKSMDDLFKFVEYSKSNLFVKAVATFYFIYYVKPFEFFSEEIALLLFKKILAKNDIEEVASMINFETIFDNIELLEKEILESQRSYDLTYILTYILKLSTKILDEALDDMTIAQNSSLKEEIYQEEIENKEENTSLLQDDEINNKNVSEIEQNDKENTISTNNVVNNVFSSIDRIAITNVPTGLNEEEARILENRLLEMDPNLSRIQAHFYARHCIVGMNYTISQFKKCEGCAYETARTGMDNLVYLGYYRKEALKNKFIYTPIKKEQKIGG